MHAPSEMTGTGFMIIPPSEWINRLTAIGGHDRHLFDKLLWGLVTSTIFVCW